LYSRTLSTQVRERRLSQATWIKNRFNSVQHDTPQCTMSVSWSTQVHTPLSFEPRPDCARLSVNGVIRPHRPQTPALLTAMVIAFTICAVLAWGTAYPQKTAPDDQWAYYGHDAGGMRFSPLTQINRENVVSLKVAWTFHTGDVSEGSGRRKRSGFETTPLFVDGTLYLTTAFNRVIALDPETGTQRWAYDPKIDLDGDYGDGLINRGAATWLDPSRPTGQACHRRIFESTRTPASWLSTPLLASLAPISTKRAKSASAMSSNTIPAGIT